MKRRRVYRRRRAGLVCALVLVFLTLGGISAVLSIPDSASFAPRTLANTFEEKKTPAASAERVGREAPAASKAPAAGAEDARASQDPIDVLLLGVDERPDGESEGLGGIRSDAILVARLDPKTGETKLLSVPRDLYVEVAPGEWDRINAAFAYGGDEQAKAVVERYTGIGIDHYAVVDFEGFEEGIDALGGVRVEVREGEYPPEWHIEPGKQKLNGRMALTYARYRESAGGDLDRIGHQQQILAAVREKVMSPKTITKLPRLVEVASRSVESDLGPAEALAMSRTFVSARDPESADDSGIATFQLTGEGTYLEDGRQVLMPNDEENQTILREFLS